VAGVFERTVNLDVEETYVKSRQLLLGKGCQVVSEEKPNAVVVKQGSLWGVSPKTAKKILTLRFSSSEGGTQVSVSSKLSSDWKNLTLIGSALSVLLAAVCVWIAVDLNALVASDTVGFWSWLATVDSYVNVQVAQTLASLTLGLAVFLVVVVVLEVVIYVVVKRKLDVFAEEVLRAV
jgi:hypothetical protein